MGPKRVTILPFKAQDPPGSQCPLDPTDQWDKIKEKKERIRR